MSADIPRDLYGAFTMPAIKNRSLVIGSRYPDDDLSVTGDKSHTGMRMRT